MIRSVTLFAHLTGMLTLFAGLGLELVSLASLERVAGRDDAAPWIRVLRALPRVYGIAFGVILLSGMPLAARVGVFGLAWVRVSFGTMVLMAIAGGPLTRSRMRAIARDESSAAFRRHTADPLLRASIRIRVALGLAVVYMMIAKTGISGSLLAIGVALLVGLSAAGLKSGMVREAA